MVYLSLVSRDFAHVRRMPKMMAKRNEVSQSTALVACPMRFHRNVTIAVVTRATANTVPNSTPSFLMFNFHSPFLKCYIFPVIFSQVRNKNHSRLRLWQWSLISAILCEVTYRHRLDRPPGRMRLLIPARHTWIGYRNKNNSSY